jgi:hypothetical protein
MPIVRQGFASPGDARHAKRQPGPTVKPPIRRVPAAPGPIDLPTIKPFSDSAGTVPADKAQWMEVPVVAGRCRRRTGKEPCAHGKATNDLGLSAG